MTNQLLKKSLRPIWRREKLFMQHSPQTYYVLASIRLLCLVVFGLVIFVFKDSGYSAWVLGCLLIVVFSERVVEAYLYEKYKHPEDEWRSVQK